RGAGATRPAPAAPPRAPRPAPARTRAARPGAPALRAGRAAPGTPGPPRRPGTRGGPRGTGRRRSASPARSPCRRPPPRPILPGRANCHFTWDREDWARKYHEILRGAALYEVRPLDFQRLFRADYVIGNAFREGDTLAKLLTRARRYWRGEVDPDGRPEILVP